ncbi:MAG: zf-HC2 domain-containing protein [Nitriliruptoraceae bacterium]|nr:zf-HC2 domain-containing protein [Nitriliruptoraceae bacterium]
MRWSRRRPAPLPDTPSCEQVGAVLQGYLDGELGPRDAELVAEHLQHCDRCSIEAETVGRVVEAIKRQRPDLAPDVRARLTGMLDELVPPDDDR